MAALTGIYIAYAATTLNESATGGYGAGTYYAAFLYEGTPTKWYYPEQLGIIQIEDLGAGENATRLSVLIPGGMSETSWVKDLIFKWEVNGKFYQISHGELHVTFGKQYPIEYLATGGIGIAGGWGFTGVLVWIGWRKGKQ
jgi:hypothetical protein